MALGAEQKPFGKFAELVVPLGMLSLRRIFANPGPRSSPERRSPRRVLWA